MEQFKSAQKAYDWFLNEIDEVSDSALITGLITGVIDHPIMVAATVDLLMERAAGDLMSAQIQEHFKSQD